MKPFLRLGKYGSHDLVRWFSDLADAPLQLKRNEKAGLYYWELRKDGVAHWWWTTLEER